MKLVLQERKKFVKMRDDDPDEYYFEYNEIEIERFRWLKNHTFEYIPKGSCRHFKLKENQEIVGLGI